MRKKRVVVIILVLISIFSYSVLAQCYSLDPKTYSQVPRDCSDDPSDPEAWNEGFTPELIGTIPTGEISANWDLIKDSPKFKEIQKHLGDRVNELDEAQIADLTEPEAIRSLDQGNIGHANAPAVVPVIDTLNDDQLGGLLDNQLDQAINNLGAEKWSSLNQNELGETLSHLSGTPVQINLGANGIGGRAFSGGFELASVGSLRVGGSVLTGGKGVVFRNGTISTNESTSFVQGTTIATLTEGLVGTHDEFFVESAREVRSDCFTITNITNSTVASGTSLKLDMGTSSQAHLTDCAAQDSQVAALANDSSLVVTKDAFNPIYIVRNVSLEFTWGPAFNSVRENVTSTGHALLNLSREFGLTSVSSAGFVEYQYQGLTVAQGWKFRSRKETFHLVIRKNESQRRQLECTDCALFDLANHSIRMKGAVELLKVPLRRGSAFEQKFHSLVEQDHITAETFLQLDNTNSIIKEQSILTDSPVIRTHPSTYFSLIEQAYEGKTTRFLHVKQRGSEFSDTAIQYYRTGYSPAGIKSEGQEMTQQRPGCTIRLAPKTTTQDALNYMRTWRTS